MVVDPETQNLQPNPKETPQISPPVSPNCILRPPLGVNSFRVSRGVIYPRRAALARPPCRPNLLPRPRNSTLLECLKSRSIALIGWEVLPPCRWPSSLSTYSPSTLCQRKV